MAASRQTKFYLATILLLVLAPFLLAEIYCRIARDKVDLWEVTGRKPTSLGSEWRFNDAFCAYTGQPGYSETIKRTGGFRTINEFGFISTPSLNIEKPDGTVRIAFLGGSSTAGISIADEDTWPWQTVEMVKKRLPNLKIDFINGAHGGYSSFESFGRLWSRIRFFDPDIVIVYLGWNEMHYFDEVDTILKWRTDDDGGWNVNRPVTKVIIEPLFIDHFVRYSQLFTRIRLRLSEPSYGEISGRKRPTELSGTYDERGLAIWRTNLQLLRATCAIIGAKLFVCKQATLIVPDLPLNERRRCRYYYHGFDHDAHIEAFDGIYRIIDEEIDENNIIDTTPISGVPEYFMDHIHLTRIGGRKVSEIVSDKLTDYLSAE